METSEKIMAESFRKVRAFAIYKTDKLIISKKSLPLKNRGSEKKYLQTLFSLTNQLDILCFWYDFEQ